MGCKECEPFGGDGWIELAISRVRCKCNPEKKAESVPVPVRIDLGTFDNPDDAIAEVERRLKRLKSGRGGEPVHVKANGQAFESKCMDLGPGVSVGDEDQFIEGTASISRKFYSDGTLEDNAGKRWSPKGYEESPGYWKDGIESGAERHAMVDGRRFSVLTIFAENGERVVIVEVNGECKRKLRSSDCVMLANQVYGDWYLFSVGLLWNENPALHRVPQEVHGCNVNDDKKTIEVSSSEDAPELSVIDLYRQLRRKGSDG